jgi:hypothetical protein
MKLWRPFICSLLLAMAAGPATAPSALALVVIGPRAGFSGDDHDFYLGLQMETMVRFTTLAMVPSVDFGPGSDASTVANVDFRLYLIPLPETGMRFYAGAGPTMMLSGDLELGLSLTAGLNIPMHGTRRYNIEYRWGLGDIPDHKFGVAILFGL